MDSVCQLFPLLKLLPKWQWLGHDVLRGEGQKKKMWSVIDALFVSTMELVTFYQIVIYLVTWNKAKISNSCESILRFESLDERWGTVLFAVFWLLTLETKWMNEYLKDIVAAEARHEYVQNLLVSDPFLAFWTCVKIIPERTVSQTGFSARLRVPKTRVWSKRYTHLPTS